MKERCIQHEDSNYYRQQQGITQSEAKELGISVIPMPVLTDGEMFLEDISITQEQFYKKLKDLSVNVSASQPSPDKVMDLWDSVLQEYDAIIHIPMSSGLPTHARISNSMRMKMTGSGDVSM